MIEDEQVPLTGRQHRCLVMGLCEPVRLAEGTARARGGLAAGIVIISHHLSTPLSQKTDVATLRLAFNFYLDTIFSINAVFKM